MLLYEATAAGISVTAIADRHGRTVGGIRARQQRMQLRDMKSGELIDPLPPLQHFAKSERQNVSSESARNVWRPKAKRVKQSSVQETIPDFVVDPDSDPISQIWAAIQHDVRHYVSSRHSDQAMRARNQDITLKRLHPGSDLRPAVSLDQLAQTYSITRERVRQVQMKSQKVLIARSIAKPRACHLVIAALIDRNVQNEGDNGSMWLTRLLLEERVSREFGQLVLRVAGKVLGLGPKDCANLTSGYSEATKKLPNAQRRAEREHQITSAKRQRTSQADGFVLNILKKATFGGNSAASEILVAADLPALRSCNGHREVFVSCLQQMVAYESSGERRLIRALDQCSVVDQFAAQALEIPYFDPEFGQRTYFPDLLLRTTEGLVFVIEIKARPLLADREVQLKAAAAEAYLGNRGVGYCVVDQNGESSDDIRNVAVSEPLKSVIRKKLQEKGVFRYSDLKSHLGSWPDDTVLDQVQSLALAYDLDYRSQLFPSAKSKNGLRLDFALRVSHPSAKRG